jgi:hypothetical protein
MQQYNNSTNCFLRFKTKGHVKNVININKHIHNTVHLFTVNKQAVQESTMYRT